LLGVRLAFRRRSPPRRRWSRWGWSMRGRRWRRAGASSRRVARRRSGSRS
jgi:hypothetical protein